MKKIVPIVLALLLAAPAFAQSTTKPNVSNTLSQCAANVPVVGSSSGNPPACHASGALGSAAFINTGTGVPAALALATNAVGGFPTYASGSWTPTITTSGTVGTPAYSIQVGTYEQIGRQVTVRFNIALSGWTGSPTGSVFITGLPFTSANVANDIGICHFPTYAVTGLTASNILTAQVNINVTTIALGQVSSTATSAVTAAQAGTTPTLVGMCSYHT